jgi:hypothetical protein
MLPSLCTSQFGTLIIHLLWTVSYFFSFSNRFCYQVLSDQQEFVKADELFMKALEVDPHNATAYVHRGTEMSV